MSELLVVVGATGGSVVQEVLKKGHYLEIRGIMRNASSTNPRYIASLGVEMVEADMNEEEFLVRAFEGATAIFAVTDFYETFRKADPWTAMDVEYRHGFFLAKAAARTPSLQHYVWGTLPAWHLDNALHLLGELWTHRRRCFA